VVTHQRLDDGRYNLMLLGMRRGRIIAELPAKRTFRQAEVELIDDVYPSSGDAARDDIQAQLAEHFRKTLPLAQQGENEDAVQELLSAEAPLGVLTDLVSFALPLKRGLKRQLLAENDVDLRARWLLDAMGHPVAIRNEPVVPARPPLYPPRFSTN
jgi:Lon protease-like protein